MLGAGGAKRAPRGGGRIDLAGWLGGVRARRFWPTYTESALVSLAFGGTAVAGAVFTLWSIATFQTNALYLPLVVPFLVIGALGLWFRNTTWLLIPNTLFWLALLTANFGSAPQPFWKLVAIAELAVACLIAYQIVVTRRRNEMQYQSTVNQLGWDLYELSKAAPITDESVEAIRISPALRVGEVERHFDQLTSASIQGQLKHAFRMRGMSGSIHDLPGIFLVDTLTFSSSAGSGESAVQLAESGISRDDLTGDSFIAVFEQSLPGGGVDTIRAVVPSERQARAYIAQLLNSWASQLGQGNEPERMLRRYAGAISEGVTSDSSYVGDRLAAILRMAPADRPVVTLIGETLGEHAILAGSIRFGSEGPLYQLFPVALVHALLALIAGRPKPPTGVPSAPAGPGDAQEDAGSKSVTDAPSPNGHRAQLTIRTVGGLRLTEGGADITSSLIDRKVLAFLWIYLLARRLRNAHDTITRASLADELSPGLDSSTQRSRLRGRLSEMRNQLPAALGKRLEVSGERISLDLTDCDIDLQRLLEASQTYSGAKGVLTADQLASIESVVSDSGGVFLPDWDDLEHHVNGARGGAGEVVADLRSRVEAARSALLRSLGEGYLAHANPAAAVAVLERALEHAPGDESAVRSLVTACLQSGRLARAEELRKEFALA
jgi:DNA-binding SARP family transcriptional activator